MTLVNSFVCSAGTFTYDRNDGTEWPTYFWKNGDKELVTNQRNAAVGDGCGGESGAYDPEYESEEGCIEITAVNTGEHQIVFFGWGVADTGATYYDIYSGIAADNAYLNGDVFCQFLQPHDESIAPSGDVVRSVVPGVAYVKENESVYYNPVPKYLVLTYNVTDISAPTHILNDWEGGMSFAEEVLVDGKKAELIPVGGSRGAAMGYQFDSTGTHTVKILIPDYMDTLPGRLFTSVPAGEFDYGSPVESLVKAKIPFGIKDIGIGCFRGCPNLTGVSLPEGLETLNGAFSESGLKSIKLPSTLKTLATSRYDDGVFRDTKIKNIVLPNNLSEIGANCFEGTDIEKIIIPDSVTSIDNRCFHNCRNLKEAIFGNGITEIPGECFYNDTSLTSVTLNEKIERIGYGAFEYTAIKNITLPDSLTYIDSEAFQYCVYLESINIPTGITEIPSSCFDSCYSLSSVTLHEGLQTIGNSAFAGCFSLTSITIPSTVTSIYNSGDVLRSCKFLSTNFVNNSSVPTPTTGYMAYWGAVIIDAENADGLLIKDNTVIGCRSFATNVTIPDGITGITTDFSACYSLTSMTVPASVTSIGYIYCGSLKEFKGPYASADGKLLVSGGTLIAFAPYGVKNYSVPEGVTEIKQSSMSNSQFSTFDDFGFNQRVVVLENLTLPNSLIRIQNYAFGNCATLKTVTFGNNLEYIGNSAFCQCVALTNFTLPNSMTGFGEGAFWRCESLTQVTIPDSVTGNLPRVFEECTGITDAVIGTGVTSLYATFMECTSLTGVTLPQTLREVGWNAFWSCATLSDITIPSGVTKLEQACFRDCTSLTSITIPNTVTKIARDVFNRASSLTGITIPNSVTEIGDSCFYDCKQLTQITLGTGLTVMSGYNMFYDCVSLTGLTVPENITRLGNYFVSGCRSLTNLTLPSTLTQMGSNIIRDCPNLSTITCHATTAPTISNNTFYMWGETVALNGVLRHPVGSDYSTWMGTGDYYLGKFGWTEQTF